MEKTLIILKPDAVQRGLVGPILARFEAKGLKIAGLKLRRFPRALIQKHYDAHKERPFFPNLVKFMTSGPCVVMAIEGENAIARYREVMGPTDSKKAPAGTIRNKYGTDIERNAVHGSDGPDTARTELAFFFAGLDTAF